ncbi:hypothetical protein DY000_02021673 [Brassica cretica]|uniref:Uncharacterized protein n=1 Tax=Brassica cretica TaxID=69181 RepID=A0ABQ7EJJ9_BRACR|nr:hypothetical protein DY000_02021673 [Brassica cretica]
MLYPGSIDHRMQGFSDKYLELQASMNQDLMVVATKPCSLLFDLYPRIHMNQALKIAATKSHSNSSCGNPYEASLNGCSHQDQSRREEPTQVAAEEPSHFEHEGGSKSEAEGLKDQGSEEAGVYQIKAQILLSKVEMN